MYWIPQNHQVSHGLSCCVTFVCQSKKKLTRKQKLKSGTRCHNGKSDLAPKVARNPVKHISSIINPTSIRHGEWITRFFFLAMPKSSPPKTLRPQPVWTGLRNTKKQHPVETLKQPVTNKVHQNGSTNTQQSRWTNEETTTDWCSEDHLVVIWVAG